MATEFKRMKQITGTTADWSANDLVLQLGEIGFEIDGGLINGKIGDGVTQFSALPNSFGGTGFIPLDGTAAGSPVTGIQKHESQTEGTTFSVGLADQIPGFEKAFLISADATSDVGSQVLIGTGSATHLFDFTASGRLNLPQIAYGAGEDAAAATKLYVDQAVAGGVSADYIPLIGTGVQPVTGIIEFENAPENTKFSLGLTGGAPGFEKAFIIGANALSDISTSVAVLTGSATHTFEFTELGRLNLPAVVYGAGDGSAATTKNYVDGASDYRLKENLAEGDTDKALSYLEALPTLEFTWKEGAPHQGEDYGWLAHVFAEVLPNLVNGEKDGEAYQTIEHRRLIPILWAQNQALLRRIKALEERLNPPGQDDPPW